MSKTNGRLGGMIYLMGLGLIAGCVTMPTMPALFTPGLNLEKREPFVISRLKGKHGRGVLTHCIALKNDSAILVDYNRGGDSAHLPEFMHLGPAVSTDGGQTWKLGEPAVRSVWPNPHDRPTRNIHLRDGTILTYGMTQTYGAGTGTQYVPLLFSLNRDGRAIGEPWTVKCRVEREIQWRIHLSDRGVQLPDGSLLIAMHTKFEQDKHRTVVVLRSTDGAKTFAQYSVVAGPGDVGWGDEGPSEPAIGVASDGKVICVMRTSSQGTVGGGRSSGPMLLGVSHDGGKTWSLRNMGYRGVKPKLITMSNGVMVCAFGRPGNHLAFSTDGVHWGHSISLTPSDAATSGYVGVVEAEPGRLLVAYDTYDEPTQSVWLWEPSYANTIYGVFVDVEYNPSG